MTWPAAIAAALGLTTALLILIHQHRSTPRATTPRRTENDREYQDQEPQAPHRRPKPPQHPGSA